MKTFIFGASGMEEVKAKPELPLYCKVYNYGYAMSETHGAVISARDAYGRQQCVSMTDYAENRFFMIDEYSRPLSKKFGIGIYYDDAFELCDEEEVKAYIAKAKQDDINRAAKAKADAEAKAAALAALPGLYPYLIPVKGHAKGSFDCAKQNIRIQLKREFPGVTFRVNSDHYGTVNVSWTDGPTVKEVTSFTSMYEDSSSDITGDYRDYTPSVFNDVFGGSQYVFERREMSDITANILTPYAKEIWDKQSYHSHNFVESFVRDIFETTSFPAGARIQGVVYNEELHDYVADLAIMAPPEIKVGSAAGKGNATMQINEAQGGVEIKFADKPGVNVIAEIKGAGFRWSMRNKVWYKKRTPSVEAYAKAFIDEYNA